MSPKTRPEIESVPKSTVTVNGTTVAYLRVSTSRDQSTDAQKHAINRAGYSPAKFFVDEGLTGRRMDRPGLSAMLDWVREGDTVVVYSLSRISRSTTDLLGLLERLDAQGVHLVSLSESVDTSTPAGRLLVTVLAALSQFEVDTLRDRTIAGLDAARAQGRVGGRPRALTPDDLVRARGLVASGNSVTKVARELRVGRSTLYRALKLAPDGSSETNRAE